MTVRFLTNDSLLFPVKCKTNGCYKMTKHKTKTCSPCRDKQKRIKDQIQWRTIEVTGKANVKHKG